jgi:hypothetical protein
MEPEGSLPHSQASATCLPEEASCLQVFLNMNVLQGGVVSTSPNPQAGGPPPVGCPRLLIRFIRSYPPYWRPFLYPQPKDAPCRGDRDPLHINVHNTPHTKSQPFGALCSRRDCDSLATALHPASVHSERVL